MYALATALSDLIGSIAFLLIAVFLLKMVETLKRVLQLQTLNLSGKHMAKLVRMLRDMDNPDPPSL